MKKKSTPIELPYYCPELKKEFNTINKLSHNVKKINLTHKEYYDKHIKRKLKCFFCNNDGKFISMSQGYRNLCNDPKCVSKSRSTNSIEGIMYIKGCTKDEALKIKTQNDLNRSKKNKAYTKKKLKENQKYTRENSSWCIEYWIKKGYNKKEANKKLKQNQQKNGQKFKNKLLNDKDFLKKFKDNNNTSINYWIKRGYNKKEANQKLKERQATFSLKLCIEKYGKELGTKRWQKRQNDWLNTMDSKSDEEKLEINKKRMHNYSGYSKISQKLFWNIYKHFKENEVIFQELSKKEVIMYNKNIKNIYMYDYVDFTNKKIIEFNGDYWHCNPEKYNEKYNHPLIKKTAKEIWEYDKQKINFAKNKGYDVLVIWEKEFKQNFDKVLKRCIEFINKKN